RRIEEFGIDCDLTWGYCDLANKPKHMDGFRADREELLGLGYQHELRLVEADQLHSVVGSDRYVGGMIDMGSGHLHPLNLARGEGEASGSWGWQRFKRLEVTGVVQGLVVTYHTGVGRVRASLLVLGCNASHSGVRPSLASRVSPAGSYVIATEHLSEE